MKNQKSHFFRQGDIFHLQPAETLYISRLTQGSGRSSGVEHNLAKVRVGRSNRLARSNISLVERVMKARIYPRLFAFLGLFSVT